MAGAGAIGYAGWRSRPTLIMGNMTGAGSQEVRRYIVGNMVQMSVLLTAAKESRWPTLERKHMVVRASSTAG